MNDWSLTLGDGHILRPMTSEDLDAVLEVENNSYTNPWPRAVFKREINQEWSHIEVICPEDDLQTTLAHIVYWIVHDELHILNVAVHPNARRKGLGKVLMRRVMEVCETERLQYVTLEVRSSNVAAIGLYKGFGFAQIGLRKRYYADNGEDALVMALVLQDDSEEGNTKA